MTAMGKLFRTIKWLTFASMAIWLVIMLPSACKQMRTEGASQNEASNSAVSSSQSTDAPKTVSSGNDVSDATVSNVETKAPEPSSMIDEQKALLTVWKRIKVAADACDAANNDAIAARQQWSAGQMTPGDFQSALERQVNVCKSTADTLASPSLVEGLTGDLRRKISDDRADCAVAYTLKTAMAQAVLDMITTGQPVDPVKVASFRSMSDSRLNVCEQNLIGVGVSHGINLVEQSQ